MDKNLTDKGRFCATVDYLELNNVVSGGCAVKHFPIYRWKNWILFSFLMWVKCVCKWENKSDRMRPSSEVPIFSSAPIRPANPLRGTKSVARAQNNQTWNASAVEEHPWGSEAKMAGTWHQTGTVKPDLTRAFRAGEGQAIFSSERFPVRWVIMQPYWNLNHTMSYNVNKMTAPFSHCSIQSPFERDNKPFLWSSRGCRVH